MNLRSFSYFAVFISGCFMMLSCSKSEDVLETAKEAPVVPEVTADVKVMTYNIHIGNPPSAGEKRDLAAIANVINEANPDLVALQEVDVNTTRSGIDVHQAKALGELTGMEYHFVKAMDVFGGGAYGIGILSKFPILEARGYQLPANPQIGGETRAVAMVTVELANGKKMVFASTHLDHRSEENREYQSTKLQNILMNIEFPVVLAGDFNDVPQSKTMDFFSENFTRTCRHNCSPTFPAHNPKSAIDFIMFRKKDHVKIISHNVIYESYPSDHLPVTAGLKLE